MRSRRRSALTVALTACGLFIAGQQPASATVSSYWANTISSHSYVYTGSVLQIWSNYISGGNGNYPAVSVFYINSSHARVNQTYGAGSVGYYSTSPSPAQAACANDSAATITAYCEWNQ